MVPRLFCFLLEEVSAFLPAPALFTQHATYKEVQAAAIFYDSLWLSSP